MSDPLQQGLVLGRLLGMLLAQEQIEERRARSEERIVQSAESMAQSMRFQEVPSAYEEALEFFRDKLNMPKAEFVKLEAELRRGAFTIYLDSREKILEMARGSLERALEEGITREDLVDDIMGQFDHLGVTAVDPHYYDMVFRTNIQEGLNRGKDAVFEQTDKEEFPMFQWFTVGDSRVRDTHARLDGFTWQRDDPIWQLLKPPLSFNCRCTRSLVHSGEGLAQSSAGQYSFIMSLIRAGDGFEFVI